MKSNMKRILISLGVMAVAAFSLTNCTKEMEQPGQNPEATGVPYTIYASSAETKTTNDGIHTKWAEGDALNVFHATAGQADYSANSQFTLVENSENQFKTTALQGELAESNDWFVLYPYDSYINTLESTGEPNGYTYIGSQSNQTQTQDGIDSKAHIAGKYYPLLGRALAVSKEDVLNVTMNHIASLIEVVVKNSTNEALEVSSVSFTATESIIGQFYVNLTAETPSFTDGNFVSETANLTVTNASIPANGTALFYLAVKPFAAKNGQTLKLSVNGYEKPLALKKDVTFTAGKIKKLTFDYDKEPEPEVPEQLGFALVKDVTKLAVGDEIVIVAADYDYALSTTQNTNNRGRQVVTKSGVNVDIDANVQVLKLEKGTLEGTFAFNTGNGYLYAASSSSNNMKTKSALDDNGSWTVAIASNGIATIKANGTYTHNTIRYNESSKIFSCYLESNTNQKDIKIYRNNDDRVQLSTPTVTAAVVNDIPSSIVVSWDAVENAIGYEVSYDGLATPVILGSEVLTYTFADLEYNKTYTFSVVAKANEDIHITSFAGMATETTGGNPDIVSETKTIYLNGGPGENKDEWVFESTPIKLIFATGSGSNKPRLDSDLMRWYTSNTLTISGATITKVEFNMNGTYTMDKVTVGGTAIVGNTWTGSSTEIIFKAGAQTRIESVVVTYTN